MPFDVHIRFYQVLFQYPESVVLNGITVIMSGGIVI